VRRKNSRDLFKSQGCSSAGNWTHAEKALTKTEKVARKWGETDRPPQSEKRKNGGLGLLEKNAETHTGKTPSSLGWQWGVVGVGDRKVMGKL